MHGLLWIKNSITFNKTIEIKPNCYVASVVVPDGVVVNTPD